MRFYGPDSNCVRRSIKWCAQLSFFMTKTTGYDSLSTLLRVNDLSVIGCWPPRVVRRFELKQEHVYQLHQVLFLYSQTDTRCSWPVLLHCCFAQFHFHCVALQLPGLLMFCWNKSTGFTLGGRTVSHSVETCYCFVVLFDSGRSDGLHLPCAPSTFWCTPRWT